MQELMSHEYLNNTIAAERNADILRRRAYWYWQPMAKPEVGTSGPDGTNVVTKSDTPTDDTFVIHRPNPTQNKTAGGIPPDPFEWSGRSWTKREILDYINGLLHIHDVNYYYGNDEIDKLGFREKSDLINYHNKAKADINNEESGSWPSGQYYQGLFGNPSASVDFTGVNPYTGDSIPNQLYYTGQPTTCHTACRGLCHLSC